VTVDTTLVLLRHAEQLRVPGDAPLTPRGVQQAREAAQALRRFAPAAIYHSPLRRAVETAAEVGRAVNLVPVAEPLLRERANWGDTPGQPFEEFAQLWEAASRNRDHAQPGMQSARATAARLAQFVSHAATRHRGGTVVAVTHGGAITDLLVEWFSPGDVHAIAPDFDPILGSGIAHASMTVLRLDGDAWQVESIGAPAAAGAQ
jgi:broad specificity phosphatase PhoE